jgi:hypothetical protein
MGDRDKEEAMNVSLNKSRLGALTLAALLSGVSTSTVTAAPRPDDRAGIRGPSSPLRASGAVRPDDRAGTRGAGSQQSVTLASPALPAGNGFDWRDAGIGAGGTLVLAALAGTAVAIRQQNRRREVHG